MNCAESEILMHALVDGEVDAVNARKVEEHIASCAACAGKLAGLRALRAAMSEKSLKEAAPLRLRRRVEAALPSPAAPPSTPPKRFAPSRRTFFAGFAAGTALSAAIAASLVLAVFGNDREQIIAGEVVSAHIRSLQPGHLTDVETSDQHMVKPWFNGKLDVAPPVIDLTAQGFTLIGGRLDYVSGEAVAAIVYRRRNHVINLFVERRSRGGSGGAKAEAMQGFNVRRWTQQGLDFWAVSDINAVELGEFCAKFADALRPGGPA